MFITVASPLVHNAPVVLSMIVVSIVALCFSVLISFTVFSCVLSICRKGKCESKSPKVKMLSYFFKRSARRGPTTFRYSMGVANMFNEVEMTVAFLQK